MGSLLVCWETRTKQDQQQKKKKFRVGVPWTSHGTQTKKIYKKIYNKKIIKRKRGFRV